jgi:hypothetical protein
MRLAWQVLSVVAIDMVARVSVWRHWIGLRGPLRTNPHDDKSPASDDIIFSSLKIPIPSQRVSKVDEQARAGAQQQMPSPSKVEK